MPGKLTVISGLYKGKEFFFNNIIDIGRDASNGIVLPFPGISRKHARIKLEGKSAVLKDLKSQNGTFLNGKIVAGEEILKDRDIIRISSFEMQFEFVDNVEQDKLAQNKASFSNESLSTGFINISELDL